MDVGIIFVLASTMFIKKSCSQTLSISPQCFSNGDTLTLICDTNDVSDVISFVLNGGNQGGCLANSGNCGAGITQSGTTTRKTISPFNDLLHSGSWTCTYGSLASVPKSIAENPCVETTEGITEGSSGSGEGSTDLKWWEILLTVLGVLVALAIIGIIIKFCCIYNTRCKGQGIRVNFTSKGRIENLTPKIEPYKKEVTPNQGRTENLIPKIEPYQKEFTPNQGRIENLIPKIEPYQKEVTPNQEQNSIDKLNKGRSSIAASQPRSGAHQPLNPLIRADGGNRIEKIYQGEETKYDESKKTKREEK